MLLPDVLTDASDRRPDRIFRPMLSRLPHWPARFESYLASRRDHYFGYGRFDCATFTADGIMALTGVDVAAEYRGQYHTRREALSRARALGLAPSVRAIAESVASRYSLPSIPVLRASAGDMVLLPRAARNGYPRDYSLGLVALSGVEILWALSVGYGRVPMARACAAWRV